MRKPDPVQSLALGLLAALVIWGLGIAAEGPPAREPRVWLERAGAGGRADGFANLQAESQVVDFGGSLDDMGLVTWDRDGHLWTLRSSGGQVETFNTDPSLPNGTPGTLRTPGPLQYAEHGRGARSAVFLVLRHGQPNLRFEVPDARRFLLAQLGIPTEALDGTWPSGLGSESESIWWLEGGQLVWYYDGEPVSFRADAIDGFRFDGRDEVRLLTYGGFFGPIRTHEVEALVRTLADAQAAQVEPPPSWNRPFEIFLR